MEIFFYILTGVAALTVLFVGASEFVFEGMKFKWYHYIPQSVINTVLGILGPYVLIFMLENAGEARGGVLGIIYIFGIILNNLIFFLIFFRSQLRNMRDLKMSAESLKKSLSPTERLMKTATL